MDPAASSFERDLLESWSAEQPAPSARARALALGGLAASSAALVSVAGAGAGAAAPKAMGLAGMAFVKWGILGVLVVGAATATVVSVRSSSEPVATSTAATTAAAAPAPNAPGAERAEPQMPRTVAPNAATPETVAATDLPAAPAPPPGRAASANTSTAAAAAAHADTLTEEITAFDAVRAGAASGDADAAIALAGAYERRYPNGTFLEEAEVLRIESLSKKGDREGAVRVGQRFLAAHPQSPHAGRIRAIVDASMP